MDEWTVFRLTREEIAKLADAADTVPLQSQIKNERMAVVSAASAELGVRRLRR